MKRRMRRKGEKGGCKKGEGGEKGEEGGGEGSRRMGGGDEGERKAEKEEIYLRRINRQVRALKRTCDF